MAVKTATGDRHNDDLEEILKSLRKYDMRLKPAKCSFNVKAGKLFGFMLTNRGMEANLVKGQAIMDMRNPTSVKEVQQLKGAWLL
jgi:hypothetical protein